MWDTSIQEGSMGLKGWEPIYNLENAAQLTGKWQLQGATAFHTSARPASQGPPAPKLVVGGWGPWALAVGLIGKSWHLHRALLCSGPLLWLYNANEWNVNKRSLKPFEIRCPFILRFSLLFQWSSRMWGINPLFILRSPFATLAK